MDRKYSDARAGAGVAGKHVRNDAPVFAVTSDPGFFDEVAKKCAGMPPIAARYPTITALSTSLAELHRITLAFVVLCEETADRIDIPALRELRLDYPQLVLLGVVGLCDQRASLRLQSVGVHSILLPPFDELDVARELTAVAPNLPQFKRHPDLMRRAQARLDFLIPSELAYVLGINHLVSMVLKEFGFPAQDARVNIPLACDEAITNAMVHGNGLDAAKKVNVQVYVSHSRFRMRVRDQGDGFDAESVADPRDGDNVLLSGGRGVFLIRRIMDSVKYREGGRVLEMEKKNAPPPTASDTSESGDGAPEKP